MYKEQHIEFGKKLSVGQSMPENTCMQFTLILVGSCI